MRFIALNQYEISIEYLQSINVHKELYRCTPGIVILRRLQWPFYRHPHCNIHKFSLHQPEMFTEIMKFNIFLHNA